MATASERHPPVARVVAVLVAAFFVVGFVSVASLLQVRSVQRAQEHDRLDRQLTLERERVERVAATCLQENDSLQKSRASKIQDAEDLILIFKQATARQGLEWGAEGDRFAAALIARKQETNLISFPFRDCSPSGIAAYLAHPPPPVACEPNGKGFCK